MCYTKAHTFRKKHFKHEEETITECSWLPYEFYSRILGRNHNRRILTALVEKGILKEEVFTYTKGTIYLYGFASDEMTISYSATPATFKRLEQKVKNYGKWKLANIEDAKRKPVSHVIDNFVKIEIGTAEIEALWENRYYTKYLPKHKDKHDTPFIKDKYMNHLNIIKLIIENWNKAEPYQKIDMFNPCDNFGDRLHSVFSYLPAELRAYITDADGIPLILTEFDLANSQPAIFANYLVQEHGMAARYDPFVEDVEKNCIYENIAEKLDITRDEAKIKMLHWLYSMVTSKAQKEFQEVYPYIGAIAHRMKSQEWDDKGQYIPFPERHKQLPMKMQRAESRMFREVWRRLINYGYKILPMHDAVYIVEEEYTKLNYAKEIIENTLRRDFIIKIKIKSDIIKKI